MSNIFSYDSAPMQVLMRLGDLILLNIVYTLCCIPVVTIGAAQAGLYTACRVMQNKEDDTSVISAFFRGFRTGFGSVTIAWGIVTLVLAVVTWLSIASIMAGSPVWLSLLAVVVVASFQAENPQAQILSVALVVDEKEQEELTEKVRISIPVATDTAADFKLVFLDKDGSIIEIEYEIIAGQIVFETEFPGFFALIPADE